MKHLVILLLIAGFAQMAAVDSLLLAQGNQSGEDSQGLLQPRPRLSRAGIPASKLKAPERGIQTVSPTQTPGRSTFQGLTDGVQEVWVSFSPTPDGDLSHGIALDGSGNVYVTGESFTNLTSNFDYGTVKYNGTGAQQWFSRYNGPSSNIDKAYAIAVDGSGNVFVTGGSVGSQNDYATVKYNGSTGDTLWVRRFGAVRNQIAAAIATDGSGNVYVTGQNYLTAANSDYGTIKYNGSTGDTVWVRGYDGGVLGLDQATAIAVDGSGNVYVTGASVGSGTGSDYATIKYNGATGDTVWVRRYNGTGNGDDAASAIGVDGSGNVYVTGSSAGSGTGYDYTTIKYSASGTEEWVMSYNGPGNDEDDALDIAVDASGNVYVTGWITTVTGYEYATIMYSTSGVQQWLTRYQNLASGNDDGATGIALDGSGNVYVTGGSLGSGTDYDIATIKYNSAGVEQWVARYNGPGNGYDYIGNGAIAVDGSGGVYVTGWTTQPGGTPGPLSYVTIKYQEVSPTTTTSLNSGWNLVSVPRVPPDYTASVLFPDAVPGTINSFITGTYTQPTTLENGQGYWAYYTSAGDNTISGSDLTSTSVAVTSGNRWVLVGSVTSEVPVANLTSSPPGAIVPGTLYGYNGTSYFVPTTFEPGKGYWVFVNAACTLTISTTSPAQ